MDDTVIGKGVRAIRSEQNRRLIEYFERAVNAVKAAHARPVELDDGVVVGMSASTGWYWVRHGGTNERYGLGADEAINTIVQFLMIWD